MKFSSKKVFFVLLAIAYTSMMYYLSDHPKPLKEIRFILGYDKVAHVFEYGIFAFLWWNALYYYNKSNLYLNKIVLICGSIYAAIDEIHQGFTPGRDASIYDWMADITGLIIVLFLLTRFKKNQAAVEKNLCG